MRVPTPPPSIDELLARLGDDSVRRLLDIVVAARRRPETGETYLPWDDVRHRPAPAGLTSEEWWLGIKLARQGMQRQLRLVDARGKPFSYALPDPSLRSLELIGRSLSGIIAVSEPVTNPATRDRYLINSLIEEAITSSQLEGASTSRVVAKEMIRTGRSPRNRDELMIANNYAAMSWVSERKDEPFTTAAVLELHHIVTAGTLDDPSAAGRLQTADEDRVAVLDLYDTVIHEPPPATLLPSRLEALCAFANGDDDGAYLPPVLRAITIHFMVGYDHPFEDGNGRTARALFYWSMLKQGFWLTEYLTISQILKNAPAQYARSYLHTEQDDGDLTYFHLYQLRIIERAMVRLEDYLKRKMREVRDFQRSLAVLPGQFNHRQLALLERAVRDPSASFTTQSHAGSHHVTVETARKDLIGLEGADLLRRGRAGKASVWRPVVGLPDVLRDL